MRDLAAPREDGQANRIGDDDSGDGKEDDDDGDADSPQHGAQLEQALHDLLPVNDVVDAAQTPDACRDGRNVVGDACFDAKLVGKRILGQQRTFDRALRALAQLRQTLFLRDELHRCDARIGRRESARSH